MAASRFELTTAGIASTARSLADMLGGLQMNAGSPAVGVHDALLNLALAVEQLEDAKGRAANVQTQPQYIAQYKLDQTHALIDPAYTKANGAIDDLASAIDKARTAAQKAVLGGNVPAKDSPLAAFQAEQIVKALEAVPSGGLARVNRIVKFLTDAQASGDSITAGLVLSGQLDVALDRLGVSKPMLFAQLGQAVQASPVADSTTTRNAELLAVLSRGGSGTIVGLPDAARYVLTNDQKSYNTWLAGMLRDGQLRGPMEGGVMSRPVEPADIGLTFTRPPKGGTFGR